MLAQNYLSSILCDHLPHSSSHPYRPEMRPASGRPPFVPNGRPHATVSSHRCPVCPRRPVSPATSSTPYSSPWRPPRAAPWRPFADVVCPPRRRHCAANSWRRSALVAPRCAVPPRNRCTARQCASVAAPPYDRSRPNRPRAHRRY